MPPFTWIGKVESNFKDVFNTVFFKVSHNKSLPNQSINNPLPGDIVVTTNPKSDKHRAKDLFIVTDSNNDKESMRGWIDVCLIQT